MQITTKLRRITLFLLSMVLSSGILLAQERTVTGKVTAEGEGAIPGVNVTVQGTTIGAMTGIDGSYTLKVPGSTSVLVFSSVGYVTQAITVGSQTTINVNLISDVQALQEVVVTGYTQQRRRDLTGSIATVAPEELTAVPTPNVSNALQGRTAGVTVVGSGEPGETARVRIRGFSSFENNDPLYIVDGVPTQDISSLNPADVASISVLKDAGAASIYGSRASNGVIIVTTKKGSSGAKVSFNMYYGIKDPGKGPDNVLNAQEYADLQWLVYKNDGTTETHPIYGPSSNPSPTMPSWAGDTDWYDAITSTAPIQNYDLSLSGGTENAKFFAGIGVNMDDGIVMYTNANRYTARFNSEFSFLDNRIKVGENITLAYRSSHGVSNLDEGSPIQQASYRSQSIIPVIWDSGPYQGVTHFWENGDWGGTGIAPRLGQAGNQVASLTRQKDNTNYNLHLIGSAFIDVKIIQGLNFKSTLGGTWDNGQWNAYTYKTYENAENTQSNALQEESYYGNDWVWTNQLTFDKTFGDHKLLVVAGYEAVEYGIGRGVGGNRANYFSDEVLYRTLSNGAKIINAYGWLNTPTTLVSQFIRGDYTFRDKYMLSATVRRDGSSRFGADNRYGVFPSFSAGWRVKGENFMTNVNWLSDLKIRGSYGTMGNQLAVSPQNQFFNYGGSPSLSFYDVTGTGNSSVQGFAPTRIGNPNAKWETNITTDVGFDASFFNNKVGLKFDWYSKKTEDLLYAVEVPGTVGAADVPYVNVASMSNTGVDLELSYKNQWGDFGFDGSAVFTTYKNNIDKIAEGITFFDPYNQTNTANRINGVPVRNQVGHPMSSFFGYHQLGLFQTTTEVSEAPDQTGAEPGFFRFEDVNNDGEITPDDRTFIGDPNPKFTYGLNLAFTYKGFDLTAFIYGSQGNDIFNWNLWWIDFWPSFQGQKSTDLLYNSWTPERTNATTPKASNKSNFSSNNEINDYYIEDGSFTRLKNLQIGYTIPQSVLSKINIGSIRIYLQGVNLFTITKYSGLDPELSGWDTTFGMDAGNYPLVKQYLVGLNVNF
jgi:TonB-dependent starch-binding outer membrane protein SusC